jgi:ABC-type spermidine/putrescine transport system permease subunit II
VFARLLLLDRQHEDSATDLGAPPNEVVRRIILPQIASAIGAASAVVFAGALGEFVIVDRLGGTGTLALAPTLFPALGGPEPVQSVVGTMLAAAGAFSWLCVVLAFRAALGLRSRLADKN